MSKNTINLRDFELSDPIGEGPLGETFQLKSKTEDLVHVIKILKTPQNKKEDKKLSHEVDMISQLKFPSIIQFLGLYSMKHNDIKTSSIISEKVSLLSLRKVMQSLKDEQSNYKLDDTAKLIIIYGIANSMLFLHSHDVIHSNLKAENIILDDNYYPYITDFALSKIIHKKLNKKTVESTKEIHGSVSHLPPEFFKKFEYTKQADVYAFAMIVYELLTGKKPFNEEDFSKVVKKVAKGSRPKLDSIPDAYKNLIEKCWDQTASNRPTFEKIVKQLKTDSAFITANVNKKQYLDFVKNFANLRNVKKQDNDKIKKSKSGDIKKTENEEVPKAQLKKAKSENFKEEDKKDKSKKQKKTDTDDDDKKDEKNKKHKKSTDNDDVKDDKEAKNKSINANSENEKKEKKEKKVKKEKEIGKEEKKDDGDDKEEKKEADNDKEEKKDDNDDKEDAKGNNDEAKINLKDTKAKSESNIKEEENPEDKRNKLRKDRSAQLIKKKKLNIEQQIREITGNKKEVKMDDDNDEKDEKGKKTKKGKKNGKEEDNKKEEEEKEKEKEKELDPLAQLQQIINNSDKNVKDKNEKDKNLNTYEVDDREVQERREILEKQNTANDRISKLEIAYADQQKNEEFEYMYQTANEIYNCAYNAYMNINPSEEYKNKQLSAIQMMGDAVEHCPPLLKGKYGIILNDAICIDEPDYEKFEKYLKFAGLIQVNQNCINTYVSLLEEGKISSEDYEALAKFYEKASEYESLSDIGKVKKSNQYFRKAIEYYKLAAHENRPYSIYKYGQMIEEGYVKEVNRSKAMDYYKKAAALNQPDSIFIIAKSIESNPHKSKTDENKARDLYEKAASFNHPEAMFRYAQIIEERSMIRPDRMKSLKYYQKAADMNHPGSLFRYAQILEEGSLVMTDRSKALEYYKKAADSNELEYVIHYAKLIKTGSLGRIDLKEAADYYQIASSLGDNESTHQLGIMLQNGEGIIQDKVRAVDYFKEAADNGHIEAMFDYAVIKQTGKDVPANKVEASRYYKMAADLGHTKAMYNLALMMKTGDGIPMNKKESDIYFAKAGAKKV